MGTLRQIVIIGASGDLTARKLIPGLLGNAIAGDLPPNTQVVGVARRPKTTDAWRDELAGWLDESARPHWEGFASSVHYSRADSLKRHEVEALRIELDRLAGEAGAEPEEIGRLFYLALKPSLFGPTVENLSLMGLLEEQPDARSWCRVVVEKPFGTDLETAKTLNRELRTHLREDQIFRIDHYLGKETVQNILAFRFQNSIFEPIWSRKHVESIEITVAETVGMSGERGRYYDTAGALRDMVQNHVLQILALITMEPPSSMDPDAVRNEKVKVLQSLTPLTPEQVSRDVVRAQYSATVAHDRDYRDEPGVPPDSKTETFVAIRAAIHNWRWNGVPFLLRTGKCLHRRYTEVILRFKVPPVDLLGGPRVEGSCALRPNALRLMIQPTEGIRLGFLVKQPGSGAVMRSAVLGFDYADITDFDTAPAYQRLLLDALAGNATLFIRGDEVEAAWRFADSIRAGWEETDPPVHTYPAGSQGPAHADELFRGCEGTWGDGNSDH